MVHSSLSRTGRASWVVHLFVRHRSIGSATRVGDAARRAFALPAMAALAAMLQLNPAMADREGTLKRSGLELLMIEEAGCAFCARWMSEVAPGYRKSSEGQRAPLVIRDRFDAEVKSFGRVVYTPTFILLRDGVERGRILGYPGADFFWSMLTDMLRRETNSEIGIGSAPSAQRDQ